MKKTKRKKIIIAHLGFPSLGPIGFSIPFRLDEKARQMGAKMARKWMREEAKKAAKNAPTKGRQISVEQFSKAHRHWSKKHLAALSALAAELRRYPLAESLKEARRLKRKVSRGKAASRRSQS